MDELYWEFYVAGVKHHQLKDVIDSLEEGDNLQLVLEPTNKYDKTAVRIQHKETMLGYVPAKISKDVTAAVTSHGSRLECEITKLRPEKEPWNQLMIRIYLP